MISLGKWKILTPLQNLPKNLGDLGQLVIAKGFKKLPKVQKIAKSGHTDLSSEAAKKLRPKIVKINVGNLLLNRFPRRFRPNSH